MPHRQPQECALPLELSLSQGDRDFRTRQAKAVVNREAISGGTLPMTRRPNNPLQLLVGNNRVASG